MSPAREELRRIWRLAAPVIVTQVAMMSLTFVDNVMLGGLSVEALGASALGRVWVMGTFLFGMGLVLGIDPIVSQAHGAHDSARAGLALQQGLAIGLLAAIPVGTLWFFTEEVLIWQGQRPELARIAEHFTLAQLPGLPCFLCFVALRHWLQGRGIVRPTVWVALLGNVVNIAGNWLLIFGHWGFPRLEVVGSGLSTGLAQIVMVSSLVGLIRWGRLHEGGWHGWTRAALAPRGLLRVATLGLPIALTICLEMWAFQLATLWSGKIDATGIALAAHTITINLASMTFMPALGISIGAATRVGNLIGAGDSQGAQRAAWVSLAMAAAWGSVTAIVFLVGRGHLPLIYTKDAAVIALASTVFPIAAAFQVFDCLQVVGSGVLRGMGRPVPSALFNLLGYYALGLPIAWWIAFKHDGGLPGIWWGLCIGLGAVAFLLVAWIGHRGPAHVHARVK